MDLSAEIYNADGSIAKNCINGARCLTKFVVDEELIIKNELSVTTLGGLWSLKTHQDGEYSVKFTTPNNLEIKNNIMINHSHKVGSLFINSFSNNSISNYLRSDLPVLINRN